MDYFTDAHFVGYASLTLSQIDESQPIGDLRNALRPTLFGF